MQKNYNQLILGVFLGVILGLFIAKFTVNKNNNTAINNIPTTKIEQPNNNENTKQNNDNNSQGNYNGHENIPQKVYEVLKYIKANNAAMDGYVGGREFTNRQNVLPELNSKGQRIQYQEWDVNPKIQGQNRGTQRICTGDDGRSWYTSDHYNSFTEIK